jgi:hypothetical protein
VPRPPAPPDPIVIAYGAGKLAEIEYDVFSTNPPAPPPPPCCVPAPPPPPTSKISTPLGSYEPGAVTLKVPDDVKMCAL